MSRKIEIELTSARPDGSWTWRVAGAKQPKGVVEGSLVPPGAKVGDVLRAEAEIELEGTTITTILAPPPKRAEPERLELLGDTRPFEGVTTSLVPKGARPRRDRDDRPPRADRGDEGRPGRGERPTGPTGRGERASSRGDRPAARGDRPPGRADRSGVRPERAAPADAPAGARRDQGDRRPRSDRPGGPGRERTEHRGEGAPSGPPRPRRLNPGSVHRNSVLDSLAPEERPVAEQLLQGGLPAVRRAVQEQNAKARADGRPEVQPDALLGLAEELLPRLKAAEWRDRAEAAAKDVDDLNLRDLRSIVAGADAGARDDESRILAKSLREALDRRESAERDAWMADITTCLDEGRVTRALRVAGRPPDPRTRFPAELMTRLTESASTAMCPDASSDRWAALLAAVLESPVRRAVKPVGLPAAPAEGLLAAARQASGRIPALAALLGLDMPPPPGPPRPGMRPPRPAPRPPAGRRPRTGPPPASRPDLPTPGRPGGPTPAPPPPPAPASASLDPVPAPAPPVVDAPAPASGASASSVVDAPADGPDVDVTTVDVTTPPEEVAHTLAAPVNGTAGDVPATEAAVVDPE